jgi:hypothetical protein
VLLAFPVSGAWAQAKDGSTVVAGSSSQPDSRSTQPGWTGRTVVLGSRSTIAGDATATRNQQTGQYGRQR